MLDQWAARHAVTPAALAELRMLLTGAPTDPAVPSGTSEAAVQARVRCLASQVGGRLWRNNVGVLPDARGVPIRFGLCNDSPAINARCKSSDLIGIRPRIVTADMVGATIGQFWARETKEAGWRYTATARERAQLTFIEMVVALGGDAGFTVGGL